VAFHTAGAALSAGAFGALLGWGGSAFGAPWGAAGLVAVAGVAALYGAGELLGLPLPVPQLHRQVPESWRWRFGPNVSSFLYGLGLGIGFLTHVRHGALVVVSVAAAASGHPAVGAVVIAPFGLSRGLSLVVVRRALTAGAQQRVAERLDRLATSGLLRMLNGFVLLLMAAAGAAVAASLAGADVGPLLAGALAGVFAWAAAAKAVDLGGWREALAAHRLGPLARPALLGVPFLEVSVAGLVLAGASRAGAALALALLVAFSGAILRARALQGDRIPCGCFGRTRARDYRALLVRNLALGVLAAAVLFTGASFPLFEWVRLPRGGEIAAAALVVVGLALAGWMARRAQAALRP
jgi:methylamine utilization protein MauE